MRLLLVAFASATVGTAGVGLTAVDAARNRALALQAEQAEPGAHRPSAVNASSDAANASSGAVTFTHFFNHYKPSDALHRTELRLVLRSWAVARKQAVSSGHLRICTDLTRGVARARLHRVSRATPALLAAVPHALQRKLGRQAQREARITRRECWLPDAPTTRRLREKRAPPPLRPPRGWHANAAARGPRYSR